MSRKKKGDLIRSVVRPAWATRIAEARNALGLSQAKLGEAISGSQQTIAGYETGDSEPNFATLERLATALGVSPEWLAFGASGEPAQDDSLIGPLIERYKKDETFVATFLRTAAMLGEEGLNTDLHFTVRLAFRLREEIKALPEDISLRERIDRVLAREREVIRSKLDDLRGSLV